MAAPSDNNSVSGRVAVVTGGGSGIGRATCRALAARGASVVAVDIKSEGVDQTLELIASDGSGGEHLGMALDVRSEEDMQAMADRAVERFGRIDILAACAGVLHGPDGRLRKLADTTLDEWNRVIDTNLRGMFLCNRAVLGPMLKQRSGDIVNVSSVSGKAGRAHDAPYCASKFGVIGMSESLGEEVRSVGVRVQVVCPDAVDTPMWEQNGPVPPPEHVLPPERVADLIVYLVEQPADTLLLGPVIAPFKTRRRRKATPKPSEGATA